MKKGGSNGEFWKKSKKQKSDGTTNSDKQASKGESLTASEIAWSNKLLPSVIKNGSPIDQTVSIAIPSSILRTAKSTELKTYLVGQIARACALYEVDEIIVYMDSPYECSGDTEKGPGIFCCRLLQYLECPSYLRSVLFPVHNDLKFVSLLPSLDMPHHMTSETISSYREGVVSEQSVANGSMVNVGQTEEVLIGHTLQPGTRVTVKLNEISPSSSSTGAKAKKQPITGEAVSPLQVRQQHGLYWGYQTRLAGSFSEIFSGCPYTSTSSDGTDVNEYDLLIGNSEKGSRSLDDNSITLKPSKHALIVFGGVGGIEACIEADDNITTLPKNAECLFDHWLDLASSRGIRKVRTEEAVLVGLSKLTTLMSKT
jgi:predicted SPOUT superfamily RNA methylase MTH1